MRRINCVPVQELTDKHLGAEYRELPRVFALAARAFARGDDPRTYPTSYVLGTGHVKFFYPRLGYLHRRLLDLVGECQQRGRKTSFTDAPRIWLLLPPSWRQDWVPTESALSLNRARIAERLTPKP